MINGKDLIVLLDASVSKDHKNENAFIIVTKENQKFTLEADNELQRDEWISAIEKTIFLLHGTLRYGRVRFFIFSYDNNGRLIFFTP